MDGDFIALKRKYRKMRAVIRSKMQTLKYATILCCKNKEKTDRRVTDGTVETRVLRLIYRQVYEYLKVVDHIKKILF